MRVGSTFANSGGVVHNVAQNILHPQYNVGASLNNDVAIVRLSSTISFNNQARAASIAGSNYNLADNQIVWATGWGDQWVSLKSVLKIFLQKSCVLNCFILTSLLSYCWHPCTLMRSSLSVKCQL